TRRLRLACSFSLKSDLEIPAKSVIVFSGELASPLTSINLEYKTRDDKINKNNMTIVLTGFF
ncbi:MAG: hypothetical protein Q8M92_00405, partial [Candidatus Subteraquimicrobiales bacterium]|nr:hypothetical protein [Candidatus Subteraquimicrobiales bacterium]